MRRGSGTQLGGSGVWAAEACWVQSLPLFWTRALPPHSAPWQEETCNEAKGAGHRLGGGRSLLWFPIYPEFTQSSLFPFTAVSLLVCITHQFFFFFFFNCGKNTYHENYPIKFLSTQYNVDNDRHRVAHQILEIYSSRIMKILYQSNSNFPSHWQPLFHFFFLPFLLL